MYFVEPLVGYFVLLGPVYNPHIAVCIGISSSLSPGPLYQGVYFVHIVEIGRYISARTSAEIVVDSGKEFYWGKNSFSKLVCVSYSSFKVDPLRRVNFQVRPFPSTKLRKFTRRIRVLFGFN